jgi:polysaccharide export outer membrane protein
MRKLLYLSVFVLFLTSCTWLTPDIMLKTGKNFKYTPHPDSVKVADYKISENDILHFNVFSNDGFKLIDLSALNNTINPRFDSDMEYFVDSEGMVKLPVLGRRKVRGLTIREAELLLEDSYSAFYVKPFVILEVINRRVVVFPGSAGDAKVIPLVNNNTTLIEALALAGGIPDYGKAYKVKLIRQKNNGENDVYLIDLSKIEGIKKGNMVLQANDLIYVEPRPRYAIKMLQEVAPFTSILLTLVLLFRVAK